jgi:hypothetical protein
LPCEREDARREFLKSAGMGNALREALAGDASTRRYERIYPASGPSLIFMDQPPSTETQPCPPEASPEERRALGYNAMARLAAGRVEAFVASAGHLRSLGLSAPEVVFANAPAGFALLEDLGDDLFARLTETGRAEAPLYQGAVDALSHIHETPPPAILASSAATWPLLVYDDLALKTGGDLLPEWLPKLTPSMRLGDEAFAEWEAFWGPVRARGEAGADVFCHRDYHAENLLWLGRRRGAARVGMLDFQDAVRAHPAWDLSMLLHDARRDVAPELEAAILERYFQLRPHVDRERFVADFHALGALNICRILGLFARLVVRDNKPRYAAFMPRLWRYLDRCLADPDLTDLRAWFENHAPSEARAA